jgi:cation transport regulator ChaB
VAEQDNRPTPDPTILTTEALIRGLAAERDFTKGEIAVLVQRLAGIDRATEVLNETVNRVPTALQEGLVHLEAVMDERFSSIASQFKERDTRSERESRDNKVAVDAAFAAQKEAAAKQDEANAKAIDKSEKATAETIKTNQELTRSTTDALTKGLDEVKLQVSRIESVKQGSKDSVTSLYALAALFFTAVSVLVGVFIATH